MRIAVGGFIQESNTFSPTRATLSDFRNHSFYLDGDVLHMPVANEVRGVLQAARDQRAEVVPTLFASAVSSGVLGQADFESLQDMMLQKVRAVAPVDGMVVCLHGALVTEDDDDPEGTFLESLRRLLGPSAHLVVTLDLHANVTCKMVSHVDAVVGYRTYPHTDFTETGYRAAELLASLVRRNVRPKVILRKIPMIVPAENSQTSHGPFADLWKAAKAAEQGPGILQVSLFPVQPWLDISELGFAVVVVAEEQSAGERVADGLAELAWAKRHEFDVELHSVEDVVRIARDTRLSRRGPVMISDSADSPSAGATGDSVFVLRKLLELGAERDLRCFLTVVDAGAVARAWTAGTGEEVSVHVGHSVNRRDGLPLSVTGRVRWLGEGRFRLSGGYAKGTEAWMGRCAVLDIGTIQLLMCERPTFTSDPAMYRCAGLEPLQADLVMVKSANQFRADYASIASETYVLDTPGCSPANLKSLPFTKLRRPFFPFDDNFDWREHHT